MSTDLIPFDNTALPAHLAGMAVSNDLAAGGSGFPILSIKGKVWHLKRGDEKTLITKPGEEDPAAAIEVVILKAYPGAGKTAKTFFPDAWEEGSDATPTCYSNDGVKPADDAVNKQCDTCAACPQNVWGSKITDQGKKTRACGDAKRLAVATLDALNDPMLLRIPPASFQALTAYNDMLTKRATPYQAVLTRIGFDYSVSHPQLTFKPLAYVPETKAPDVLAAIDSPVVRQITGEDYTPRPPRDDAPAKPAVKPAAPKVEVKVEAEAPKPTAAPKAAAKPAAAPKAAAKPEAAKPAAAPVEEAGADMDKILDGLDFDD